MADSSHILFARVLQRAACCPFPGNARASSRSWLALNHFQGSLASSALALVPAVVNKGQSWKTRAESLSRSLGVILLTLCISLLLTALLSFSLFFSSLIGFSQSIFRKWTASTRQVVDTSFLIVPSVYLSSNHFFLTSPHRHSLTLQQWQDLLLSSRYLPFSSPTCGPLPVRRPPMQHFPLLHPSTRWVHPISAWRSFRSRSANPRLSDQISLLLSSISPFTMTVLSLRDTSSLLLFNWRKRDRICMIPREYVRAIELRCQ